ncbi:MAG TPA: aminotransferase class I/II-fold pyridoxal phosphate-dependent enzyme [Fulvivirga sp.]|nr:aminotransferase class I/II-fold pyridoxal phosphate-dependent enzyme [Fulvivirga sp.]
MDEQGILKKLDELNFTFEPSEQERKHYLSQIESYTSKFYDALPNLPTYSPTGYSTESEDDFLKVENTDDFNGILTYINERIDAHGLQPASGGHLGYIPGGGLYEAALGDYLASVSNQYSGVSYASPGAVRLENSLIQWVGKIVGYTLGFAGNLTSGGSIANLIAINTAKHSKQINSQNVRKSVIYTTQQTHHSLLKAIKLTGLDECVVRVIAMDETFSMLTNAFEKTVVEDLQNGLNPFLVISNAGSTDVGAVDPLEDISNIAQKHGLWHHVDAAYGGFFMLTEAGRKTLKGIEKADSIILDPHKGLFLSYGSGVVLVKDGLKLKNAFSQEANYMQDTVGEYDWSPADLSPELSRPFRGLRMWIPLKIHGVAKFSQCLDEKLLLANYFYVKIKALGFETGPQPALSVVLFRYVPSDGEANDFNKAAVANIHHSCKVFISTTSIDNVFWLRVAILSFRTKRKEVDVLLGHLKDYLAGVKVK